MRVAIAGAGAVGRSIAQALLADDHKVLLIERSRVSYRPERVPGADWMLADACELGTLTAAGIETCDVVMAASGDDKVNLVFALLAKTECRVPRVVARINDPDNEWLFTPAWGVDVAVSTPRALAAGVEEAVTVGEIVHLMTLNHSQADILSITVPAESAVSGTALAALSLPAGAAPLTIFRDGVVITARADTRLEPGDRVLLAASADLLPQIHAAFRLH